MMIAGARWGIGRYLLSTYSRYLLATATLGGTVPGAILMVVWLGGVEVSEYLREGLRYLKVGPKRNLKSKMYSIMYDDTELAM